MSEDVLGRGENSEFEERSAKSGDGRARIRQGERLLGAFAAEGGFGER